MLVTIPKSVTTIKLKQYSLVVLSVCLFFPGENENRHTLLLRRVEGCIVHRNRISGYRNLIKVKSLKYYIRSYIHGNLKGDTHISICICQPTFKCFTSFVWEHRRAPAAASFPVIVAWKRGCFMTWWQHYLVPVFSFTDRQTAHQNKLA